MDSNDILSLLETGRPIPKRNGEVFFAFRQPHATCEYIEMRYVATGLSGILWIYSPTVIT